MRSFLFTLTLALAFGAIPAAEAQISCEPKSLHSRESLESSILRYIDRYNALVRASQVPAPAPGKPDSEAKANELISGQMKMDRVSRASYCTSQRIHDADNGGTFARRMSGGIGLNLNINPMLTGLAVDLLGHDDMTFNQAIADLIADYYETPENRDAIYALLSEISQQLDKDPARPNYPFLRYAFDGTMAAWTVLTIWEWRGGGKGLLNDARSIYSGADRGMDWMLSRLRGSAAEASESRSIIPSLREAQEWARESARQTGRSAGTALSRLEDTPQRLADLLRNASQRQALSRRVLRQTLRYLRQMGLSAVSGGSLGALYAWNEQSEPGKISPIDAVELFQGYAILDLENELIEFQQNLLSQLSGPALKNKYSEMLRGDASLSKEVADAEQLERKYQSEYAHFERDAKRFQGNVRYRTIAVGGPSGVQDFVSASYRLNRIARRMRAHIHDLAAGKGLAEDDLVVSLGPSAQHLRDVDDFLRALKQQLQVFKGLSAQDQMKILKLKP